MHVKHSRKNMVLTWYSKLLIEWLTACFMSNQHWNIWNKKLPRQFTEIDSSILCAAWQPFYEASTFRSTTWVGSRYWLMRMGLLWSWALKINIDEPSVGWLCGTWNALDTGPITESWIIQLTAIPTLIFKATHTISMGLYVSHNSRDLIS